MKKGVEWNLTLEELVRKTNFWSVISFYALITTILGAFIVLFVTVFINDIRNKVLLLGSYFVFCIIFLGFTYITEVFRKSYESKINKIKNQKKIEKIRQISKKGNLKNFVKIKSQEIEKDILLHGIAKIEIEDFIDKEFSIKIKLKVDDEIFMIITISKEDFISLLQDEEKQELLDKLIYTIEVNKTSGEEEKELNELRISTFRNQYYKGGTTNSELLELLDLKE